MTVVCSGMYGSDDDDGDDDGNDDNNGDGDIDDSRN